MRLKAIKMVATNKTTKPDKNTKSAICSNRLLIDLSRRIAMKERMQLVIKSITAATANSSISDPSVRANFFKEVNTMKQIPSRFAEVLRICGDLFSAIANPFLLT